MANEGCPCGGCVTCACSAIPGMDDDGLCASCGGQPLALAVLVEGVTPHVGVEAEGEVERARIARFIAEGIGKATVPVGATPRAVAVRFGDDKMTVLLEDGREISVPLAWFPRLLGATGEQRSNYRAISGGVGLHWPEIDEDVSVSALLARPHPQQRLPACESHDIAQAALHEAADYLTEARDRFPATSREVERAGSLARDSWEALGSAAEALVRAGAALRREPDRREPILRAAWGKLNGGRWIEDPWDRTNYLMDEHRRIAELVGEFWAFRAQGTLEAVRARGLPQRLPSLSAREALGWVRSLRGSAFYPGARQMLHAWRAERVYRKRVERLREDQSRRLLEAARSRDALIARLRDGAE